MFCKRKERICFAILLCISLSYLIEIVEASKKAKVAKAVVKGVVERKLHKSHSRRFFPIWAIVLLVLGSTSILALVIFLYCFWKRSQTQSCWPTNV